MAFFLLKFFCKEAVCGNVTGSLEGMFGINLFSQVEAEVIYRLKKLSISRMSKPNIVPTDPALCQEIANGSSAAPALQTFMDQTSSSEIVAASALVVCEKTFLKRFKGVFMGACLNLTHFSKTIILFFQFQI